MATIRHADPADARAIAAIWNPLIRDTLVTFRPDERSADEVEAMIRGRPGAFLVAGSAGTVQGFATFGPFRAGPGYRHSAEHTIIVAAGARGRGTGRALMEALVAAAGRNEVHALIGAIAAANAAGVAFHAALDFAEVGRLPEVGRKFDRWLDLILMQRLL